jgi:DNA primase
MADEITELLKHATTVLYKGKNGEIKALHVVIPMDPGKLKLEFTDIQLLAKEIAKQLKEDS